MVRPLILSFLFLASTGYLAAQKELGQTRQGQNINIDTSSINSKSNASKTKKKAERDKAKVEKKGKFKENWAVPYPNPYRAGIYSLILPSAGQIYNKRYWKAPIVWGGFAALIYSIDYNRSNYNELNEAYGASVKGLPHEYDRFTTEALKNQRDFHNKNLQLSYVGLVGMYALAALDAYVDAHLKNFDISDDLSMNMTAIRQGGIQPSIGPALSFKWRLD